jgi:cardiolipin synthase
MDVVIEDEHFAGLMEQMYLEDLENATEIVLDSKRRVRSPNQPQQKRPAGTRSGGSSGRAAAGAIRIGNTVGAAVTNRRLLEPVEARIMLAAGVVLVMLAILFAIFPRLLAYPLVVAFIWIATVLLYRAYTLHRHKGRPERGPLQSSESSRRTEGRAQAPSRRKTKEGEFHDRN